MKPWAHGVLKNLQSNFGLFMLLQKGRGEKNGSKETTYPSHEKSYGN